MSKTRLEAFSDGVIAILITIMVLEMKVPHRADLHALTALAPVFASYVLSFVFIGIYWNNHHHLLHAAECVNGKILWANLHLLFWLSLIPFVSGWMGENGFPAIAVSLYGLVLLFSGTAYYLLSRLLILQHGADSKLAKAIGSDKKGLLSVSLYAVAIVAAFYQTWISLLLYTLVAVIWLVPDKRIERVLEVEECEE
jgi:uncharacterized membrane protein